MQSLIQFVNIFELPANTRVSFIIHSNATDVDQRKMVCMVVPIDFVSSSFMDLKNEHFTTHMYDSITENEEKRKSNALEIVSIPNDYFFEIFFFQN